MRLAIRSDGSIVRAVRPHHYVLAAAGVLALAWAAAHVVLLAFVMELVLGTVLGRRSGRRAQAFELAAEIARARPRGRPQDREPLLAFEGSSDE